MRNILVVDDEKRPRILMSKIIQKKLKQNLNKDLIKVDDVSTEKDAIQKLRNNEYDVVIADLYMFGDKNSGIKVLNEAKKLYNETAKRILISAYPEPVENNGNFFISKLEQNSYDELIAIAA